MGFDVVYFNLYKIFIGFYGGGGFGLGFVGVKKDLIFYLLKLVLIKKEGYFIFDYDCFYLIGCVKLYYGNFGINVRVYMYICFMGFDGLKVVIENVVLNVNYMMRKFVFYYDFLFDCYCKYEFVLLGKWQKKLGVCMLDIVKWLFDFGYYLFMIYFLFNVEECIMIELIEMELKEILDVFIDVMI